jgi:hypothetical protein
VRIVVRSAADLPEKLTNHKDVPVTHASALELSHDELAQHVRDCAAVASCLGHNLTFKRIFGAPRKLVTNATRRLCSAIKANNLDGSTKFVLMNTTGNSNRDLNEQISFSQKCVIWLLRSLLPPHVDNENAADYLRTQIGQSDGTIEWAVVRPDGLINETETSEVTLHPSPTRSAIFDAGITSRINVGRFMTDLISDDPSWNEWKGKIPVIYNVGRETTLAQNS